MTSANPIPTQPTIGASGVTADPRARGLAGWMFTLAAMVFIMVVVGGITRLTESGLSIVDWRPFTGLFPPMNEGEWQRVFEAYQAYPEFQKVNREMTLAAFKGIFWWEYIHRLWGRLIGVVFLLPFIYFLASGTLRGPAAWRTSLAFVLGGAQAGLGWFMVKSGLADDPRVSPYRLAAHLGLAVIIYGYLLWLALAFRDQYRAPIRLHTRAPAWTRRAAGLLLAWVFLVILSGAFVAGLDAGLAYNTFPLMGGEWVPPDLFHLTPAWRNFFENVTLVQFDHRLLGTLTLFLTIALALAVWRAARQQLIPAPALAGFHVMAGVAALQVILGVATLLAYVPVSLGALHQANALVLFTLALWTRYRLTDHGRHETG
ncbi:MAG: COX15/CtaA family protein [Alphaproteobacteria bacterium]